MQMERMASFGDEPMPSHMQFSSEVWDKYYELNLKSRSNLAMVRSCEGLRSPRG
jgi:hypothetical protein